MPLDLEAIRNGCDHQWEGQGECKVVGGQPPRVYIHIDWCVECGAIRRTMREVVGGKKHKEKFLAPTLIARVEELEKERPLRWEVAENRVAIMVPMARFADEQDAKIYAESYPWCGFRDREEGK